MARKENQNIKAHLPQHTPSDSVWNKIEEKLNAVKSDGIDSTPTALSKSLPKHRPSESVWSEIEHQLSADETRRRLPVHYPKDSIWARVENKIDKQDSVKSKRFSVLKWAAVFILAATAAVVLKNILTDKPKLEYHVEWEDAHEPNAADTIRAGFGSEGIEGDELIDQLCQRSRATCDTPEFKELEAELQQLETARAEIKAQMSPYSDNSNLERMLVHIELEHTKIVNDMTQKLL